MAERISPTLRRRRLAARLRQLREQAGMTITEVARAVEWTPSKMTWIEANRGKRPNPNDVRLLCGVYGVEEPEQEYLIQLARDGRKKGWWDPYVETLPNPYHSYVGLEAEAATMLNYEPLIIPGLLQTEDYARAMIRAAEPEISAADVETRVEVRLTRQAGLGQEPPLRLVAVLDEAALHRQVGGPETMRAQLQHLIEATEKFPRVTVQVIPFGRGAYPSMTNGFVILQYPEQRDPDAAYVENAAGGLWLEEAEEVGRHHVAFQHLLGAANNPNATIRLIARMAKSVS